MKNFWLTLAALSSITYMHAQPVSLAFNPTIGSCVRFEVTRNATTNQPGANGNLPGMTTSTLAYYALSLTALEYTDSCYVVAFTCDSAFIAMQAGVEHAAAGSYPAGNVQAADNPLAGKSVVLHISKQGKLLDIQGLDAVVAQMDVRQPGMNMAALLANMVMELVRMTVPEYADNPLTAGQVWGYSGHADTGVYQYAEGVQYRLDDVTDAQATLSLRAVVEPAGGDEYAEVMGRRMKMKPSGTAEGTLTVDRNTGWITASEVRRSTTMETTFENMPVALPPSTNTEQITVKRK